MKLNEILDGNEKKFVFIKRKGNKLEEGDLIPMPVNTFYIPNTDYEFYRMLQYVVDPDKGPRGHLVSDPHSIMIASTPEEKKFLQKIFDKAGILWVDQPADAGNTASSRTIDKVVLPKKIHTDKDDVDMTDLMNHNIYNSDNDPNNKPAEKPPLKPFKVKADGTNGTSKQPEKKKSSWDNTPNVGSGEKPVLVNPKEREKYIIDVGGGKDVKGRKFTMNQATLQ